GGDSVALMQFLLLVEKRLGRRITPDHLVRATTPARLAALLSSTTPASHAGPLKLTPHDVFPGLAIIPLRAEGDRPPLFLAAPAGGSVVPYFALAARFDAEMPVYGLQVYVPWSQRRLRMDIQALGRAFAEKIAHMWPERPCVVGGWSFGGFLALSVASELEKLGREVRRVLVIDSDMTLPGRHTTLRTLLADTAMFYRVLWHARSHFFNHAHVVIKATLQRGARRDGQPLNALDRLIMRWLWRAGAGDAEIAAHIKDDEHDLLARCGELECLFTMRVFIRAIQAFVPPVVRADIEVLQPAAATEARAALWQRATTGSVHARAIPGNHVSLLDKTHVSVLAGICAKALADDDGQPCQCANTA
ncbi:MAG: hypothetical protein JNG86_07385, partial [Verrucomicrobiaceae bacterium]|nr:hypothetical protein [Verrucomicrobiaceae bacterium]